jgi:hypothetical protein
LKLIVFFNHFNLFRWQNRGSKSGPITRSITKVSNDVYWIIIIRIITKSWNVASLHLMQQNLCSCKLTQKRDRQSVKLSQQLGTAKSAIFYSSKLLYTKLLLRTRTF